MTTNDRRPEIPPIVWLIAVAVFALQLSAAGRYGLFRDEYYYLMCADHPAWGYVDHPPLAMIVLKLWKSVFGASLFALRVPPALLNGMAAAGAALIAREMRGGAAAQALAAVTRRPGDPAGAGTAPSAVADPQRLAHAGVHAQRP